MALRLSNLDEARQKDRDYYKKNSSKIVKEKRKWKDDNKEKLRAIRLLPENKEKRRIHKNKRKQEDPAYKLRERISVAIYQKLKVNNCHKSNSFLKFLPYTIAALKSHLESQFESWMNWSNHGPFLAHKWDDQDQSTWRWQIDHIIPQAILPYKSMEEDNFQKCWALKNLRPYSAKQNVLDGTSRIRHKDDYETK